MSKASGPSPDVKTDFPVSATQRIYRELRRKIIRGEITPGEKLKIHTLTALFDIGASPIREALSLLTSDQLVERIDQRGFRAAPASEANFREILTLRCALGDIAVRGSIRQGDSAWEEALVLIHHRLARADRDDVEQWETLHKDFHMGLLSACGSPLLLRYCSQLYDLNIRYRYLAGQADAYAARDITGEHQELLDAVLNRDADLAAQRLIAHYTRTGSYLAAQFAQAHRFNDSRQSATEG